MLSHPLRLILIGGSSHSGKSTLAKALGERLGWRVQSTDYLARHPGRPWSRPDWPVPPHVVEHYRTLDVDALLADVLRHYRGTIWPKVVEIVNPGETGPESPDRSESLVLEGSALLPDLVVTLPQDHVRAVWLTCSEACFTQRMHTESDYSRRTLAEKTLIDKFLARTLAYDAWMVGEVRRLGQTCLDIEQAGSLDELLYVCMNV